MRNSMPRIIGVAALSVWTAGCVATTQWTEDLLGKREAEFEGRFVEVETTQREQGKRLDRVEGRVAVLETRYTRQGPAPEKTNAVISQAPVPRTLISVVHVPFAFDRADLDNNAEAALSTIVTELRDHPRMNLDLEGTTDPAGSLQYNLKLSQRRVDAVKRWLIDNGVEPARVINATARGPVTDTFVKNDSKRRVMVKLMRSPE